MDEMTECARREAAAKEAAPATTTKPEAPAGPSAEEIATAEEAVKAGAEKAQALFRQRIIAAVAAGRKESVFVDFGGMALRGEIVSADTEGFVVKTGSGDVPVTWDSQMGKRFADIAGQYAAETPDEKVQLAALYWVCGEKGKAGEKMAGVTINEGEWATVAQRLQLLIQSSR